MTNCLPFLLLSHRKSMCTVLNMAVKTITIDQDAYQLLVQHKRPGQSFSVVIKEHLGPRKTAAALLRVLPSLTFKEETLDEIEAHVKDRRRHVARIPRL
jgi:predicted CopG family antitoxin